MYRTVVVPLDGSELAEHAIPHAMAIAGACGALLHLARTYDPMAHLMLGSGALAAESGYTASELIEENERLERSEAEAYLAAKAEELRGQGVTVDWSIGRGSAVEALAALIERVQAPIVVMTTRGRGGLKRFVLGSVTDGLLHRVEVPVVVVPNRPD